MCPLVESICVKEGQLQNVGYHNARLNQARRMMYGSSDDWLLEEMIQVEGVLLDVVYKCRFVYDTKPRTIEFLPYEKRIVTSIQLVENNEIEYFFKSTDRSALNAAKDKVKHADDVLFVKNGFLTDCSSSNIVFFDGRRWVTPSTPLLYGTRRQFYIDLGVIDVEPMRIEDLNRFSMARLINAMVSLEESEDITVDNILL